MEFAASTAWLFSERFTRACNGADVKRHAVKSPPHIATLNRRRLANPQGLNIRATAVFFFGLIEAVS
jgi:hypothetical protein